MTEHDDSPERRRAERVPVNADFADVPSTSYISDLSEGGVFVHTRRRVPIGTVLELAFTVLLEDPFVLQGRGQVVRHSKNPPGMGIRFIQPSPELVLRINDVVARQRPIETGPPAGDSLEDEQTVHRAPRPTRNDDLESQKTGLYPSIRIQVHDFDGSGFDDDDEQTQVSSATMQLAEGDVEEILEAGASGTGGRGEATVDLEDSEVEYIRRHSDDGDP